MGGRNGYSSGKRSLIRNVPPAYLLKKKFEEVWKKEEKKKVEESWKKLEKSWKKVRKKVEKNMM